MNAETNALMRVLSRLDQTRADTEDMLDAFLRIPSVSAKSEHDPDCARAADWVAERLAAIGFEVSIDPTGGKPVVRATHPGPGGAQAGLPRVLLYGHYDVQPAEPLGPWTGAPFEPRFVEGPNGRRVIARGAVDDKGQVLTWLAALTAWHAEAGGPPVPVTVIVEGEEEVGSPSLEPYLASHGALLASDIAVISDTGMWDIDTPALTTRLRGLAYVEVTLSGPSRDLHSGMYGGSALNPLNALTEMLGGLHDEDGAVAIPGFYDGIEAPSSEILESWDRLGFDEGRFLGDIGLASPSGEVARSPLERLWARPTADINGIWGGYQGEGAKTVIARTASAKVSFRLVPGQSPEAVVAGFEAWCRARARPGSSLSFAYFGAAPGMVIADDNGYVDAARTALAAEYDRPAVLIGCGGSIPVVESLKRMLGIDSLMMGFGLEDDQIHGPDEKFEMRCLHHGSRAHARLLAALAAGATGASAQDRIRRSA